MKVAGDRKTATGRFPYSIQAGTPVTGDSSLVHMARLQAEGVLQWWEGGIYVRLKKEGALSIVCSFEYRRNECEQ
jgi:hypothetical protein